MKCKDESEWEKQSAELEADGPIGQAFRQYLETWVNRAEDLMTRYEETDDLPVLCLRDALSFADERHGRISASFMGQMLVVLLTHWEHGEQMLADLTPIEMRLFEDVLAMKVLELQKQAAMVEDEEDEVLDEQS
jgi:hypothetical protein